MKDESRMWHLPNDSGHDVKFTGECIGSAANEFDRAYGTAWSGETGRRYEYDLYRTASGKYVCVKIMYTQWQGARPSHCRDMHHVGRGVQIFRALRAR